MLVGHAWPLWTGDIVVLSARPVDPRDLFRGEFVRLDTPATTVTIARPGAPRPERAAIPTVGPWPDEKLLGRIVFVQLAARPDGGTPEYEAVSISREPIAGAVNLRGRVRSVPSDTNVIRIHYGLDAFFMQEGMRAGRRVQMEVAVARSGRARIRNLIIDGTPLPR
jgi:hypothetical protein